MYVRDGELGEIFKNLFGLFHKYLVIVECTQTHVVLSKERERNREKKKEEKKKDCSIFLHECGAERKDWVKKRDGPLRISTQ
jgi:hypothetical protein